MQRDSLSSVAKSVLVGQDLKVFSALMIVYGALEKQRNDLAHGCFGYAPDNEEYIIWIELKNHLSFQTRVISSERRGDSITGDRHIELKKNMFVYQMQDFDRLYNDMNEFWQAIFWFNGYLREPRNPRRIEEFKNLQNFSQIREVLSRL